MTETSSYRCEIPVVFLIANKTATSSIYLLCNGFQYALDGLRVKHGHFGGGSGVDKKKKKKREKNSCRRHSNCRGGAPRRGDEIHKGAKAKRERVLSHAHAHARTRRVHTRDTHAHRQWTSEITFYRKRRGLLKINTILLPRGVPPTSAVAGRRHRASSRPLPPRMSPSTGIPPPRPPTDNSVDRRARQEGR